MFGLYRRRKARSPWGWGGLHGGRPATGVGEGRDCPSREWGGFRGRSCLAPGRRAAERPGAGVAGPCLGRQGLATTGGRASRLSRRGARANGILPLRQGRRIRPPLAERPRNPMFRTTHVAGLKNQCPLGRLRSEKQGSNLHARIYNPMLYQLSYFRVTFGCHVGTCPGFRPWHTVSAAPPAPEGGDPLPLRASPSGW